MAVTEKSIPSDGSSSYTFEFEYLKPSDIKVSVAGVATTEFTVPPSAPTTIQFNSGHVPANGAGTIRIYRDTTVDNLSATFYAGSAIKSQDLNDNFNQSLFVTQEAKRDIITAWQDGDDTVNSTEAWHTSDDTKIATTKAIENRIGTKIDAALTTDVSGGDGVTITDDSPASGQIRVDLDTNISTLKDMQTGAATQLKNLTSTELAILDGKTFKTSTGNLDNQSDDEIPSSKVIANYVASSQLAIGGFKTIADETKFPNDMPEAGVVVSINDAHGIVVNGSGVANQGTTVGGTTVTINNFPSSLYNETLAAGTGLIVTATSTANTYNYHKLLATEADVKQLSDDINDFNSRFRIASSDPSSNNDNGDLYWNTSTNKMRVYEAAHTRWIDLVTAGDTSITTLTASDASVENGGSAASFNGTAWRFKLNNSALNTNHTAAHHLVSLAGVIQKPNTGTAQPSSGYAINGDDIVFASPPAADTGIFITTIGSALTIGTPSDNTVTNAKIVDDTIAEAKLDIHNAPSTGTVLKYTSNGMEWDSVSDPVVITANRTAVTGDLVIVNGSGLTVTLPATPNSGDHVEIRVLGTRYCTIARNGSNIESTASDFYIDVIDGYTKLMYTDATRGWLVLN